MQYKYKCPECGKKYVNLKPCINHFAKYHSKAAIAFFIQHAGGK